MKKAILAAAAVASLALVGCAPTPGYVYPPSGITAGCYAGPDSLYHFGQQRLNNTYTYVTLDCTGPWGMATLVAAPTSGDALTECQMLSATFTSVTALNPTYPTAPADGWRCVV